MDSPTARFVAALLSQTPGSEVVESVPGYTRISLPLPPVKVVVAVVEVAGPLFQLDERIKQIVEGAKLGEPLHLVLINPGGAEVTALLQAHVRPMALQMKQMGGWNWVPGQEIVSVRGVGLGQVTAAAQLANSSVPFESMVQASHHELRSFQAMVMERKPVVSWSIAAVCVAVFGLQMLWGGGLPVLAASRMGAEIPSKVLAGEWWRLFSVMLLHANFFHLLMNMLAMLSFGPFLERLMGSGRYLVLFVLSGLGGSLFSLARGGDGIGVGASGGIWGLMVAGAVAVTWPRGLMPASLALQLRQRAWLPVGINLIYSLQPGIDMLAHLGGGLAGGLLVLGLTRGAVPGQLLKRSWLITGLAVGVTLLLAGSMAIALEQGRPWELSGPWTLAPTTLEGTDLALSVPTQMESKHVPGSKQWRWGTLESGAELFVTVTPETSEVDPASALDQVVTEVSKPPAGLHWGQPPKKRKLPSGREVVFAEMIPDDKDDVRFIWRWWSLEDGPQWVEVLSNALNSTSPERRRQLEAIADSVISSKP